MILYLNTKRFSLLNILYLPAIYLITYVPALILGKPFSQILEAYGMQIAAYSHMVLGFPNLYTLLPDNYELFSTASYIITAIALGLIAFAVLRQKQLQMSPKKKIELALIVCITTVFLLPKMHKRYMFMADLFAILFLFIKPKQFFIPVTIWIINSMIYSPYLFGTELWFDYRVVSLILLGILLYLIFAFLKSNVQVEEEVC